MTDITIDNGGIRLAASTYGSADATPVLFLHGIAQSRDTWDEMASHLTRQYRIWTLDFRGHGHSDRASTYDLADYASDAEAALRAIGRPALVVGHSLGACVSGVLAQKPRPDLRAILLEDPPWYLGEPAEWQRSAFPRLFATIRARQASLQHKRAPFSAWLDLVSQAPSHMGGVSSDHASARQLLSQASAFQRQDLRCWDNTAAAPDGLFGVIATSEPFQCPAKIIQADGCMGAALLDGHELRLAMTNPAAEIVRYQGCGHTPHRTRAFEARFLDDAARFLASFA
jgi:pimeloyl-ACP methyl ester carboxylesterase